MATKILQVLFFGLVLIALNVSNAIGMGFLGENQKKANIKAAEEMRKGAISPKVFRSAEEFLREKFPKFQTEEKWYASSTGFVLYLSHNIRMILRWDGTFEVVKSSFFQRNLLYKGDWTQWR